MNRKTELKIQAFLDGEVCPAEAEEVKRFVQSSAEASNLLGELSWTRKVIRDNEVALVVPERREFYWHKIEQSIHELVQETTQEIRPAISLWFNWRKWLAPVSGLAFAALLVTGIIRHYEFKFHGPAPRYLALVESPSEEMGALSFRSQSENMFVVWLYDRPVEKQRELSFVNDLVIQ